MAVYFVAAQVVTAGVAPTTAAAYTSAGAGISLLGAAALLRPEMPATALGPAAALGAATAVAFVLQYAAIARIGSARVSIANMLEPVATVALAALLLGEPLSARMLAGAALIVAALPVLAGRRRVPAEVP